MGMWHGKVAEVYDVQNNRHVIMGFVIDGNRSFVPYTCMYFDLVCSVGCYMFAMSLLIRMRDGMERLSGIVSYVTSRRWHPNGKGKAS